jgi:type I restriction enzyme, S subunit
VAGEWRELRLREVCDRVDYGLTASATAVDTGVRFLRISDIVTGRLDWRAVPFVEAGERTRQRYRLRTGDIVIARTGSTTGHSLWLGDVPEDAVFASYLVRLRVSAEHDSRFIGYALRSAAFRSYVAGAVGDKSAQPNASASTLTSAILAVPPKATQQAIAATLGALDDKIALNDRVAATADALRTAAWQAAVARDPVNVPLSRVADFVNGRPFTRGATGHGRMVVRIAEITSGPGPSTVYHDLDVADRHLTRPGDVLFAWSGSLTVARWFRPEAIVNQHIFKVIPRPGFPAWLAYEAVSSRLARYRAIAADKATTMGHIQRRHLDEPVTLPRHPPDLEGLWQRALSAEQESLALARLRETLLREMTAGRLRIRDG